MAPKKKSEQPQFISIEGNIGSGKSTVLKIIRQNFPQLQILDQPLTEWQNVGENKNIDLLSLYYKDPTRWGFTFQIYAFMSRLKKWTEYSQMACDHIRISQRSLLSDRYIFASIMKDMAILDQAQHSIYEQFYDHLVKMNSIVDLFGVIYIRCPPQTCAQRISKRSRQGQGSIPLDYLTRIHEKHEEWLNSDKSSAQNSDSSHTLLIDNTEPLQAQSIIDSVAKWLELRNQTIETMIET